MIKIENNIHLTNEIIYIIEMSSKLTPADVRCIFDEFTSSIRGDHVRGLQMLQERTPNLHELLTSYDFSQLEMLSVDSQMALYLSDIKPFAAYFDMFSRFVKQNNKIKPGVAFKPCKHYTITNEREYMVQMYLLEVIRYNDFDEIDKWVCGQSHTDFLCLIDFTSFFESMSDECYQRWMYHFVNGTIDTPTNKHEFNNYGRANLINVVFHPKCPPEFIQKYREWKKNPDLFETHHLLKTAFQIYNVMNTKDYNKIKPFIAPTINLEKFWDISIPKVHYTCDMFQLLMQNVKHPEIVSIICQDDVVSTQLTFAQFAEVAASFKDCEWLKQIVESKYTTSLDRIFYFDDYTTKRLFEWFKPHRVIRAAQYICNSSKPFEGKTYLTRDKYFWTHDTVTLLKHPSEPYVVSDTCTAYLNFLDNEPALNMLFTNLMNGGKNISFKYVKNVLDFMGPEPSWSPIQYFNIVFASLLFFRTHKKYGRCNEPSHLVISVVNLLKLCAKHKVAGDFDKCLPLFESFVQSRTVMTKAMYDATVNVVKMVNSTKALELLQQYKCNDWIKTDNSVYTYIVPTLTPLPEIPIATVIDAETATNLMVPIMTPTAPPHEPVVKKHSEVFSKPRTYKPTRTPSGRVAV